MEAHFVHHNIENNDLGVLGVLLVPGVVNAAFAQLAAAFPARADTEVIVATVDVNGLLPVTLGYWVLRGLPHHAPLHRERGLDAGDAIARSR